MNRESPAMPVWRGLLLAAPTHRRRCGGMVATSLKSLDEIREGSLIAAPYVPTIEPG